MLVELSQAIEERDPETSGHSHRVTRLATGVAVALAWDERRLRTLELGGLLHDLGKLAVPAFVLGKPGPLDARERACVRLHPTVGARLVERVATLRAAAPSVLHHHERWDGGGYPLRLAGAAIPEEARLLAVADAFDAMTSNRPYRAALTATRALDELGRCAGSQFDPRLVRAFLDVWGDVATRGAA
jgi:HD-GYP domain-containing protein (c-di-GMP phosphodiesterase class II)